MRAALGLLPARCLGFANKDSPCKEAIGENIRWITLDSSENGFQYSLANGTYNNCVRDAAASGTVMRKVSGATDFLCGQDMFSVFDRAARLAKSSSISIPEYDVRIGNYWLEQVREYAEGLKTRQQAIEDFKKQLKDELNISAE